MITALMCGRWVELADLEPGALFETRRGIRAVKSEYTYSNGSQCQCVLLGSGEYAHFANGNKEVVRPLYLIERREESN